MSTKHNGPHVPNYFHILENIFPLFKTFAQAFFVCMKMVIECVPPQCTFVCGVPAKRAQTASPHWIG
jgi:hypothetical protein